MNSSNKKQIQLNTTHPIDHLLEISEHIRNGRDPSNLSSAHRVTTGRIWFRGEPEKYDTYLTPKIFRKEHRIHSESELIFAFKHQYYIDGKNYTSETEWLGLMQHYGIPTRLLDWTENILVGLYFCLGDKEEQDEKDGVLYIYPITNRFGHSDSSTINIPIYSTTSNSVKFYSMLALSNSTEEICNLIKNTYQHATFEFEKNKIIKIILPGKTTDYLPYLYPQVIEYFAPRWHERIIAQQGIFTIHFGKYINNQEILPTDIKKDGAGFQNSFYKIIIPKEIKKNIQTKLRLMGVDKHTLFATKDNFYQNFCERKVF